MKWTNGAFTWQQKRRRQLSLNQDLGRLSQDCHCKAVIDISSKAAPEQVTLELQSVLQHINIKGSVEDWVVYGFWTCDIIFEGMEPENNILTLMSTVRSNNREIYTLLLRHKDDVYMYIWLYRSTDKLTLTLGGRLFQICSFLSYWKWGWDCWECCFCVFPGVFVLYSLHLYFLTLKYSA